jgi:hypothetical protein
VCFAERFAALRAPLVDFHLKSDPSPRRPIAGFDSRLNGKDARSTVDAEFQAAGGRTY